MDTCKVCENTKIVKLFERGRPSISSVSTLMPVDTIVFECLDCGHLQSGPLPDIENFYDNKYEISLESEEHDQLFQDPNGKFVNRTEFQAEILKLFLDDDDLNLLDYGAGKANSLKILEKKQNIIPFVFDVSTSYQRSWNKWLPTEQQATHKVPKSWKGKFDCISLHFVVEHLPEPIETMFKIKKLLKEKGKVFFTVPDYTQNIGDLLVVDHLNKFTRKSLHKLAEKLNLNVHTISTELMPGSFVCVFEKLDHVKIMQPSAVLESETAASHFERCKSIIKIIENQTYGGNIAIFGAGFYGTLAASILSENVICFLDNNVHLQGNKHMGKPVLAPEDCPSQIESIVFAVNPERYLTILDSEKPKLPQNIKFYGLN